MKLSIIIPYYNGNKYISDVLEDLLCQDMSSDDYEIIVIDDDSTEEPVALQDYCRRYPQIRYARYSHQGISGARNRGIEMAKGDYVFFCDCDDRVRRNAFGRLVDLASEKRLEMLFFEITYLFEDIPYQPSSVPEGNPVLSEEPLSGDAYLARRPRMQCGPWHFITQRKYLLESGIRFADEAFGIEDQMFMLRILLASSRAAHVNMEVYGYVRRKRSFSNYTGKVLQARRFAEGRLWFVSRILETIRPGLLCEDCIRRRAGRVAFQMLHTNLLYLPFNENLDMIKRLKAVGAYPITSLYEGYPWLRRIMNIYPVWTGCCLAYHILPRFAKELICKRLQQRN